MIQVTYCPRYLSQHSVTVWRYQQLPSCWYKQFPTPYHGKYALTFVVRVSPFHPICSTFSSLLIIPTHQPPYFSPFLSHLLPLSFFLHLHSISFPPSCLPSFLFSSLSFLLSPSSSIHFTQNPYLLVLGAYCLPTYTTSWRQMRSCPCTKLRHS